MRKQIIITRADGVEAPLFDYYAPTSSGTPWGVYDAVHNNTDVLHYGHGRVWVGREAPSAEVAEHGRLIIPNGASLQLVVGSLRARLTNHLPGAQWRIVDAPTALWREELNPAVFDAPIDRDLVEEEYEATLRLKEAVGRYHAPVHDVTRHAADEVGVLSALDIQYFVRVYKERSPDQVDAEGKPRVRFMVKCFESLEKARVLEPTTMKLDAFVARFLDFEAWARRTGVVVLPEDENDPRYKDLLRQARGLGEARREEAVAWIKEPLWADNEFGIATTANEIAHVYVHGPSSCMDGRAFSEEYHPARVYAHPSGDIGLAYLKKGKRYTARGLVNLKNKTVSRIYGNAAELRLHLKRHGFDDEPVDNALAGCRVSLIENGCRTIMPYVDAVVDAAMPMLVAHGKEPGTLLLVETHCGDLDGDRLDVDFDPYGRIGLPSEDVDDLAGIAGSTGGKLIPVNRSRRAVAHCDDCNCAIYDEDDINHVGMDGERTICDDCMGDYLYCEETSEYLHEDDVERVGFLVGVSGRSSYEFTWGYVADSFVADGAYLEVTEGDAARAMAWNYRTKIYHAAAVVEEQEWNDHFDRWDDSGRIWRIDEFEAAGGLVDRSTTPPTGYFPIPQTDQFAHLTAA